MKHWEYGLSKATREDVLDRLNDIGGHIQGIETMVDRNAGSLEVVHQMSAVQSALEIINSLLVHEYLDHWLEDVNGPGEPMDEIEAAAKLELLLTLVRIAQQPHTDEGMSML